MFSDIHSARSDPIGPKHSKRFIINNPNIYFDSEQNSINHSGDSNSQRWKNLLLPQIDEKYCEIMNERQGASKRVQVDNDRSGISGVSKASKIILSNSRMKDFQTAQKFYEDKIESLQQQNENLRQQLFYLRQALLLNFQTKSKAQTIQKQLKVNQSSTK